MMHGFMGNGYTFRAGNSVKIVYKVFHLRIGLFKIRLGGNKENQTGVKNRLPLLNTIGGKKCMKSP